jgi:predicted outer membrane repeat protein
LCVTGYGIVIRDNVIRNNVADSLGGGIHASHENFNIRNNLITQNSAQYGGGIFLSPPSWWATSLIVSNTISDNNATFLGGGIYCKDIQISQLSVLLNNICDNQNYGLYNEEPVTIDAEYNWWGDATGPYHPVLNPGGLGDSVSDYVDFIPWGQSPVSIDEAPQAQPVKESDKIRATIIRGALQLPKNKKYRIFDITGRMISTEQMKPGIYFIEDENKTVTKVVKVR